MKREYQEASSFFRANEARFNLWGGLEVKRGLRECQLGAYWAVWSHFTATGEPALVSLPTGAGKTALMEALSFGLHATRVLIITPAELLRDQTARDFESLDILKRIGVLQKGTTTPTVFSNERRLKTEADWKSLSSYDVVTATPKTTSPAEVGICTPPSGLFDLVFLDEAHHAPAKTWASILKEFRGSKCILLTATPFRRDRRRILAPLIYHYSIDRAIKSGIYRPVDYHAVEAGMNRSARDNALCKRAKRVLNHERKLGNNSKLLIRTDNVEWANHLVGLYAKHDINVKAVDYTKSWNENKATIDDVRNDNLDGMVCVGMLGEGLDLPELKIAVLHAAPLSLPFTLQFVGRVSRFAERQVGQAHLISIPEEVRGEMRRLHRRDANWRVLIPKLADRVVGKIAEMRTFKSQNFHDGFDLNPMTLEPFFSTHIYGALPRDINMDPDIELPDNVEMCLREQPTSEDPVIWITSSEYEPPWAKDSGLVETRFDLHVYYYHKVANLLFEITTASKIGGVLRKAIAGDHSSRVAPDKIMGALSRGTKGTYFMVGLRNALGRGPLQPSYKTLLGTDVQSAVRPSDGRAFAPGHALIQLSKEETRGVATAQSRIWAIKRDNIIEYKKWCDELAKELEPCPGLPQLDFLASPQNISGLAERPVAVLLDDRLYRAITSIRYSKADGKTIQGDIVPYAEIVAYRTRELEVEFIFHSSEPGCRVIYSAEKLPIWDVIDKQNLDIRLEFSDDNIFVGNLATYLIKFPPRLVMPSGGVIINRQHWRPSEEPAPLPESCLHEIQWSGCDVRVEGGAAMKGKKNVHDWIEEKLLREVHNDAIIVKDHGPGEIADFVIIEPKKFLISFLHCKGTRGGTPGDRVKDAYEVLGQACRTSQRITKDLLNDLTTQTKPPRSSPYIRGDSTILERLAIKIGSNKWKYRAVVVQPGFRCGDVARSKKINALLVATYEWLSNASVDFRVWGS